MKAAHCTESDLRAALDTINADRYSDNIEIRELRPDGRGFRFRLFAKGFDKPGYRRGLSNYQHPDYPPKRMRNACWHVHGHFFDALFAVAPDASVRAGDSTITRQHGNWTDRNIGSLYRPLYFSEACDCSEWTEPIEYAEPGISARGSW